MPGMDLSRDAILFSIALSASETDGGREFSFCALFVDLVSEWCRACGS